MVIFFGVIITAAGAAVGDSVASALALRGGEGLDAGSVRGLWDTQWMAYTGSGLGIGTIGAGTAMAVLRRGLYPSWYGWLSALVALLGLLTVIDFLTIDTAGIFGLLGFGALMIWTLVSSILLYRESTA